MDTLSILMHILGMIINCAKLVACAVAVLTFIALVRYMSLRCRGLLPSVAATAFVISMVSADIESAFELLSLLWAKVSATVLMFSGGVTALFVLFALLLCCAISVKFDLSNYKSFTSGKCDCKAASADLHKLSNSFLAITPVLLS